MIVRHLVAALAALAVAGPSPAADAPEAEASHLARQGLVVDFSASPLSGAGPLTEDAFAEVRFRITDETTGQPVRGLAPGAWMDIAEVIRNKEGAEQKTCKEKIALYL